MSLYSDGTRLINIGGGIASVPSGFLAASHYMLRVAPLTTIYPRPNTETSTFARHRWAYYDGTNSVQYRIPIGVRGGSPPYVFELITGPPGMLIESPYWVPGNTATQMLNAGYGDVIWTPTSSTSNATVTVRVYSQEYQTDPTQYVDVTWTVSTSSSTSQFIFVDPVNGIDTNSGTISSPIKTLTQLFSGPAGSTVYLRSGTHLATSSMQFSASTPAAVINFTGESPIIDITNSNNQTCFGFSGNEIDNFFQGFSFTGVASANTSADGHYEYFWPGQQAFRWTQHLISYPNVFSGVSAANNSSGTYFSDFNPPNTSPESFSQYIYFKGCSETGRILPGGTGHSYGLFCNFATQYGLAEFNTITAAGQGNLYLKATNRNWTRRFNNCQMTNTNPGLTSNDQINGSTESQDDEVCYNLILNTGADNPTLLFNENQQSNAVTNSYSYRNTIIGTGAVGGDTTSGPFTFNSDVIQYGSSSQAVIFWVTGHGWSGGTLPSNISDSNTQCQATTGVVDSSYNLTGTYKTNWYGQRGWEIA